MTIEIVRLLDDVPKVAWGALSLLISVAAYSFYIHRTIRDKDVQPHPFSWSAWTFATFIAALVQSVNGAGWGALVTWFTSVSCAGVWMVAVWKQRRRGKAGGEIHPNSRWDWASLVLSLTAATLFGSALFFRWVQGPNLSAFFATIADVVAYKPTISKGWKRPGSDSSWAFFLNALKFAPAWPALSQRSPATLVFPVTLMVFNTGVCVMLLLRRWWLSRR